MAAPQATHDDTSQPQTQEFSKEDDKIFLELENYCWEDDPEFQSGLNQILASAQEPEKVRQLTRQAKCFFYSRKIGKQLSFPLYSDWLDREEASGPRCRSRSCEVGPPTDPTPIGAPSQKPICTDSDSSTPVTATKDEASTDGKAAAGGEDGGSKEDANTPYPTSFAQIVELITSGKPIPGIREIPNTLNTAPPSQATKPPRRKPWEVPAESSG